MKLTRAFYERDTLTVAKELLGKCLVHHSSEGIAAGRIVEVEAYIGPDDAAAHTYKNLRSGRTNIAFGPGGYAYVYLIYGMHRCFNIVTNTAGKPELVFIRALEPLEGLDLMKCRRKTDDVNKLCNGPGKLCSAMDITRDHYGMDLCGDALYLVEGGPVCEDDIVSGPRINIDYAGEAKDYPWRFYLRGDRFISRL